MLGLGMSKKTDKEENEEVKGSIKKRSEYMNF